MKCSGGTSAMPWSDTTIRFTFPASPRCSTPVMMAPTALSNPGDGRVGFRRTRTELVAGLVHVAQVESDQLRGPARWQREPLEHLSHSVGVGDLGVEDLVVGR